jgi:hypothetical protein
MNVQDNEQRSEIQATPHKFEAIDPLAGSILSHRNSKKSGTGTNTLRSISPAKSALSTAFRNKATSNLKEGLPPSPRLESMNQEEEKELNIED